jgi:hypothetical protein
VADLATGDRQLGNGHRFRHLQEHYASVFPRHLDRKRPANIMTAASPLSPFRASGYVLGPGIEAFGSGPDGGVRQVSAAGCRIPAQLIRGMASGSCSPSSRSGSSGRGPTQPGSGGRSRPSWTLGLTRARQAVPAPRRRDLAARAGGRLAAASRGRPASGLRLA